jgi:hypothetical protein
MLMKSAQPLLADPADADEALRSLAVLVEHADLAVLVDPDARDDPETN